MACEFICDGCGKRESAWHNGKDWFKPHNWYQRADANGILNACSPECVAKIVKKLNEEVPAVVAPW